MFCVQTLLLWSEMSINNAGKKAIKEETTVVITYWLMSVLHFSYTRPFSPWQ